MTDQAFIEKTLELAEKGRGRVSPNPMVGAVIVKNNGIIAEGFHQRFGGEHAEVVACNKARESVKGATLYVNLEPCSHYGKQPPCVDRIVQEGIERVVIGTRDPNPIVNGSGIRFLQEHGVQVQAGVLENRCEDLNEAYFKFVKSGLPLTTLKIAQTLDGRIATKTGASKWITSEPARRYAHQLRSQNDAILVGIGTVLSDDPQLTVRLARGMNPTRIVLDSLLRIPLSARILSEELAGDTVIVTTERASSEKMASLDKRGSQVWVTEADSGGRIDLPALWKKIGERGLTSVLIEGGSHIYTAALKANLVDKIAVFIAPKILGTGISAIQELGINHLQDGLQLFDLQTKQLGGDLLLLGYLHKRTH